MIIQITQKLAAFFDVTPSKDLPSDPNPFANWLTQPFSADGQAYYLIANATAFYSLIMDAEEIRTPGAFLAELARLMDQTLTADGCQTIFQQHIVPSGNRIVFSTFTDKSQLATMRYLTTSAKQLMEEGGFPPLKSSLMLNERPMKRHNFQTPHEVFVDMCG